MESAITNHHTLKDYQLLSKQLEALSEGETNRIAILSNASSLLNQFLTEINWVGFYLYDGSELVLGPFQGKPACIRIAWGKGVCGTSIAENKVLRVKDVHAFPGHIACDAASNSEIVLPLIKNEVIIGVLDIDSPIFDRFNETDEEGLLLFTTTLLNYL